MASKADWVSVKIDTVEEKVWRLINRPHQSLNLDKILFGILEFANSYKGTLITETMLVRNLNDRIEQIEKITDFLKQFSRGISYLSIPIRPPAESWVEPPTEETLLKAYDVLSSEVNHVEMLIGYEGNAFAFTGDVKEDLLSITSVHPMREEGVTEFLKKADADWGIVKRLIQDGKLVEVGYKGKKYYMRKF